jgi:hypothetical protein
VIAARASGYNEKTELADEDPDREATMKGFQALALTVLLLPPLGACRKKPSDPVPPPKAAADTPPVDEIAASAAVAAPGTALTTSCAIVNPTTVEGYARNDSADSYQVSGIVTFSFGDPTLPHPSQQAQANAPVSAHSSALIARIRPAFTVAPSGGCRLDLGGSARKQ